jgi:glucose uptake protein GlcU
MKKSILVYGLSTGTVIIGSMLLGIFYATSFSQWLGYLIMLVAMTLIFIGVKRYRDQEQGGVITFGRAFVLGLGIALVASLVYVLVWEIYLALTHYAFIHDYTASIIQRRQAEGITDEQMQALMAQMQKLTAQYANPAYRLPMTFAEIFPVGLLVALISAGILRFSNILPARPQT